MSMNTYKVSLERFDFTYNNVEFEGIIDVDSNPMELLLGAKYESWATILLINNNYQTEMSNSDFYKLCNILHLKPGKGSITSFDFLKYVSAHMPSVSAGILIRPSVIMRYRKPDNDDESDNYKTVFIGWNDHKTDGRKARNFDKTERYYGKKVADFCRIHNISSIWTYPKSGCEVKPSFPPGY